MFEPYLTTPDVFLRTEAAKLWVTPTRLVPSTSTIWSFTLILIHTQMTASFNTLCNNSTSCVTLCSRSVCACQLKHGWSWFSPHTMSLTHLQRPRKITSWLMQQNYDKRKKGDKQTGLSCIFTLFSKLQSCQTFSRSQISTAIAPDYCLPKRQKRWSSKQTRRANEDTEAS